MKILYVLIGASILLSFGCKKNTLDYGDVQKITEDDVIVKINYGSMYSDDRSVFIRFNGTRVTPLIQARQPYPGGGWNTRGDSRADFLVAQPGDLSVEVCLPHKVDNGTDSLVLYSTDFTVERGKRYTVHIGDTAASTKSLLTEEDFSMPDSGYARYRFINMMPNVPAVDLYYGQSATTTIADKLVAANVGFMEIGDYFTLNRAAARTWKIRPAGAAVTNETVMATYTSANTLLNQRTYTIFALGYKDKTTTAQKPYVSFFHVR